MYRAAGRNVRAGGRTVGTHLAGVSGNQSEETPMARADKPKHQDLPTNDDVRDKGKRPFVDPADDIDAAEAEREAAQRVLRAPAARPNGIHRASPAPAPQRKTPRRTRAARRP